jgi:hypothetical protein
MTNRLQASCWSFVRCWLMCCLASPAIAQTATATLAIDANKIENVLSPTLYGQFAEFMFEDIKGGLSAELVRDRGFDEQPICAGTTEILGARPRRPK